MRERHVQLIGRLNVHWQQRDSKRGSCLFQRNHCERNVGVTSSPKNRNSGGSGNNFLQDLKPFRVGLPGGLESHASHISTRARQTFDHANVDWRAYR